MIIYLLFTCDEHKSTSSRSLRGVFTDLGLLEEAQETLIRNEVVGRDRRDDEDIDDFYNEMKEEYFDILSIEENEFAKDGGFY